MQRFRVPIGRIAGIRLWLHASWFLVAALAIWAISGAFKDGYPGLPPLERAAMAVITTVCFFGCLVTHEVAHAVVARRFGVRVRGITLFLLGGVAEIEGEIPSPSEEFAVALVGPATSLALASGFGLLWRLAAAAHATGAAGVALTLAAVNLGVAVFNLIPGLPLDGGRLLRAAVWRRTGSFEGATKVASAAGRVLAILLALSGAVAAIAGDPTGLWYIPMGAFIFFMARASGRGGPPRRDGALAWTGEHDAARS